MSSLFSNGVPLPMASRPDIASLPKINLQCGAFG
jgi:hypothetical protein